MNMPASPFPSTVSAMSVTGVFSREAAAWIIERTGVSLMPIVPTTPGIYHTWVRFPSAQDQRRRCFVDQYAVRFVDNDDVATALLQ